MAIPSAEVIWQMTEKELSKYLERQFSGAEKRRICFYAPSFMYYKTRYYCSSSNKFPTISVTGKGCALKCRHCGGVLLNTMYPATTPDALYELCSKLKEEGALGCLISGGCQPNGSVPLDRFINAIAKVKDELGLTVFVHTGVVNFETAKALKNAGVDAALLDIIGSDGTIRDIYRLHMSTKDYRDSLRALDDAGIDFVPHVIVGLHYGKLEGEFNALRMISEYRPSALVIIAFMQIRRTEMATVKPPQPTDIARVTACARIMFPDIPLVLGCMRSRDVCRNDTEILTIKAGVDAIAYPTEEAIKFAKSQGFETSFSPLCCSQIYMDLKARVTAELRQQRSSPRIPRRLQQERRAEQAMRQRRTL